MKGQLVVIGSNSFSGSSFCKYMLDKGADLIGVSRSVQPIDPLLPHSKVRSGNFQFRQLDLNNDLTEIERVLDRSRPSHVFNFAAQSMVGQSWEYPEHWFMTNAVSTIKLHNILRQKDYLDKYVHISTPEVYGSCSGFVTEDHILNPSTPYAVSRAAADMSLKTFFDTHQFPVVLTRAANVFGPGQQLYRIIPKTIMSILLGIKLPLHGGGLSERSFIHIDDVSQATQMIAEKGTCGETYHISTSRIVSIRRLVEMICQSLQVDFNEVCEVSADRMGKDAAYLLDTDKINKELGWQDKVSLEQGIEQCVKWARDNFAVLRSQSLNYIHKV
jgi:dTDP-glucose 4,6-dehydratase